MRIKRRDFFKVASGASLTLLGSKALAKPSGVQQDFENSLGILVDVALCVGCRKCELACQEANGLPTQEPIEYDDKSIFEKHRRPTEKDITVINRVENPDRPTKPYYLKVQCMHCNHPACVSACIVGALRKSPEGPVTYDAWKCMGCRYCMVACPFQVPAYEYRNALDPQVRKCTFCFERIKENKRPACVQVCPNEALTFGRRRDLLALAHERIMQYPERYHDYVYGEHEIGGTSWMYISPVDFTKTELPELGPDPIPERTEKIQHGIFKSFVPPIALYGLLGLAMFISQRDRRKGDHDERT